MITGSNTTNTWLRRVRTALLLAATVLAAPLVAQTPTPDFCGCRDNPNSLGAFDTRDKTTWPPGTTVSSNVVTLPTPADGVLVFDSMRIEWANNQGVACCTVEVGFQRNAANTPVTVLVKGDVNVVNTGYLSVRGATGGQATSDVFGAGGLGGNGGFRGGDGAYRLANGATDGGVALGPAGGVGATGTPAAGAGGGTFIGATDLLPLVGGSGGGGGRSTTSSTSCSGGGGGGGGGGLLLAANGTITLNNANGNTGSIWADGGSGGGATSFSCASGGGGGAGGALRLIANTITGAGRIFARGGRRWEDGLQAGAGVIRMESFTNNINVTFTDPVASRTTTPGPLVNPFTPSVVVTAVAGQPVPAAPQGVFGGIDVQIPSPGPAAIDLASDGVPAGTIVEVKVKPRVGAPALAQNVTLANCDGSGHCLASITFDLAAGLYAVEARATFQSPAP
jgi:hypothetical protein